MSELFQTTLRKVFMYLHELSCARAGIHRPEAPGVSVIAHHHIPAPSQHVICHNTCFTYTRYLPQILWMYYKYLSGSPATFNNL